MSYQNVVFRTTLGSLKSILQVCFICMQAGVAHLSTELLFDTVGLS